MKFHDHILATTCKEQVRQGLAWLRASQTYFDAIRDDEVRKNLALQIDAMIDSDFDTDDLVVNVNA